MLRIPTDKHDLRSKITIREPLRPIGNTFFANLLAPPSSSLKAGGACVPYAPSGHRPCAVFRSIEKGWEGSYVKDVHRSNGPTDELYRTTGRSVLRMNYMVLRKGPSINRSRKRTIHYLVRDHWSIGPTYELRIAIKDHRLLGPTRTTL